MRIPRSIILVTLLVSLQGAASAGIFDNISRFSDLFVDPPTLECLGFRWHINGDDDGDAEGKIVFRERGHSQWRQALPMRRINREVTNFDFGAYACDNLLAGSIFGLTPGTEYEVNIKIADPDGGEADTTLVVATRAVPVRAKPSRTLHLYPGGAASGELTFVSLADIVPVLVPGDEVLVHAGTHKIGREGIRIEAIGTAEHPIVFRGADDGTAVLASDFDIVLLDIRDTAHLWFEGLTIRTGDIEVEDSRARKSVMNDTSHLNHTFFADRASWLTVQRCILENVRMGLYSYSEESANWYIADNVIIGRNTAWYPRTSDNPSHTGINLYGRGHVICHNRISGFWDCIAIANYGKPPRDRELQCVAIDIYRNELSESVDDAIETDYGCHNIRVYENRIRNTHTGISAQPTYGGPVYMIRNVVYNATALPLKLHNWCAGLEIYHNTLFSARQGFQSYPRWQNTLMMNNLFVGASRYAAETGSPTRTTHLDYNGWRKPESDTFIKWDDGGGYKRYDTLADFTAGTGFEAHGVLVDYDCFVNASAPGEGNTYGADFGDLRLHESCRAVDAGMVLSTIDDDFTGDAPDMGAYERGVNPPVYGPRNGK